MLTHGDFNRLCEKIMEIDKKIRFVGIIDQDGKLVGGGMRSGIKPIGDKKDDESLYCGIVTRAKMRQGSDSVLGQVSFAMSYRERVVIMSFPIKDNLLLLSAEKEIDLSATPFKVLNLLRR
ncbi:MAG: hypothetical protein KGH89_05445 [Thaumarchaeota archaeon]|nr:hypothetical protein [Nitrososphaerota archaeon]